MSHLGGVLSQPAAVLDEPPTCAPAIHSYDRREHDFVTAVSQIFEGAELARLGDDRRYDLFDRERDQSTDFHGRFYRNFDAIRPLYHHFVATVAAGIVGEPFCVQRVPTFRIHLPSNVAVGEFHTDGDYNHPVGELNFWVPLTRAWESNTIWIETALRKGDCAPAPRLGPGQFLTFDAVRWRHGNVPNETGSTRVSFDFRCIPLARYAEGDGRSVNTGQRFVIGDYFEVLPSTEGSI
ncbi:MAG TPA: hypothetical protein VFJ85_13245 [Acidimicrobiales bacterium]|nr:hypothetical protein [Acidimicrobiales bacterium]